MVYNVLLDCKSGVLCLAILIFVVSCTPTGQVTENKVSSNKPVPTIDQSEVQERKDNNSIKLIYRNRNTDLELHLNPNTDNFILDLKGLNPAKKDTVVIADSTLVKNRATDLKNMLSAFRQAQDLFYKGEYNEALLEINKSLRIQETADAYGLKGTIYFMLGRKAATKENWNKAVQLNPNITFPDIPELENIIKEIKGE